MPTSTDIALHAHCPSRRGVLDRANSAIGVRWMRDHWGLPATIAQSLAIIARADAALTLERVLRANATVRKLRSA